MPAFNYEPHEAQQAIHNCRARFRVLSTGRRFGKTMCLAAELLGRGGTEVAGDYGWVAPTYNVAERGIEAFREIAGDLVRVSGRAPVRIDFETVVGASRVWFLSADNAENIRGYGFRGLVIDEAASIPVDVWHYVLRPTISQTLGWAMFVSTPKGRNWFYDMFLRGKDPTDTEVASFRYCSNASPYFPASEWIAARDTLPQDVFRQEYQAEFLEDGAGVFRGIEHCEMPVMAPVVSGWVPGRTVVIGCDVAKHTDFTVLVAMDSVTGQCLAMERFNQLDWPTQKDRIVAFARRYFGRVILDATGIGDPLYDDLQRVLPDIEAFKLTQGSKTDLIQRLVVGIEQRVVSWPGPACGDADWAALSAELRRYEYAIGPSGGISYSAPSGYHDDCVIALALANHGRWQHGRAGQMVAISQPTRRRLSLGRRRSRVLA